MRARRVVVLGGAGFLGSHLCERFLSRGAEVVCVDNHLTGSPEHLAHLAGRPGFEAVEADVTRPLRIEGRVDAVLNLASPASPVDYQNYPIETLLAGSRGTYNALELAHEKEARFVLASTSEVYGDPLQHPQPETYWGNVNPVGPRSCYDEAKRFAEALTWSYAREHRVRAGIVRIFNTYGPRMRADDGRVIPTLVGQALTGRPMTIAGDGTQTRSFCYVDDLVDGLTRMTWSDVPGPINLGNPREWTMLELAAMIRAETRSDSAIEFYPLPEDDPRVRRPDITRARRELGWAPIIGLAEGLRRTIQWTRTGRVGHQTAARTR